MVRVTFLLRLALLGMSVSTCLATSNSAVDEADDVKRAMDSPLFADEQEPIDLPITSPVSDLIASAIDRLILSQDTHFKSQDTQFADLLETIKSQDPRSSEVLQVLHVVNDKQEKRSALLQQLVDIAQKTSDITQKTYDITQKTFDLQERKGSHISRPIS